MGVRHMRQLSLLIFDGSKFDVITAVSSAVMTSNFDPSKINSDS